MNFFMHGVKAFTRFQSETYNAMQSLGYLKSVSKFTVFGVSRQRSGGIRWWADHTAPFSPTFSRGFLVQQRFEKRL